jgi:uncharacterized damage-inducible protein DinB
VQWFERKFSFDLPVEAFPVVLERLRGTPARIEEKVKLWLPARLIRRDGEQWSIQEHIGHLADLDELHSGRLDDFAAGLATLRPADLENRKTWAASHNSRSIVVILGLFRREREAFVARLENLAAEEWGKTAIHPRLQQPMRVLDMALFVAEHDDHHLAKITALMRKMA